MKLQANLAALKARDVMVMRKLLSVVIKSCCCRARAQKQQMHSASNSCVLTKRVSALWDFSLPAQHINPLKVLNAKLNRGVAVFASGPLHDMDRMVL